MATILDDFAEKKAKLQDLLATLMKKDEQRQLKDKEWDLIIECLQNEIDGIDETIREIDAKD